MALDEDSGSLRLDYAGGGEGTRADGEDSCWLGDGGKLAEQGAHLIEGERSPVGFNEGAVEAVGFVCGGHCR